MHASVQTGSARYKILPYTCRLAQLRIDSTEKREYMFVPRVFRVRLLMNMPCIYANGLYDYVNTVALRFIGKCVMLVLLSMSYLL